MLRTASSRANASVSTLLAGGDHQPELDGQRHNELLGLVVKRTPNIKAYEKAEPALIEKLLEVRARLIEADPGEAISTDYWE